MNVLIYQSSETPTIPLDMVGALTMTAVKSDQQPYPLGSHLSYKTAPIVFNPPGSEKISVSHENNPSWLGLFSWLTEIFSDPGGSNTIGAEPLDLPMVVIKY